MLDFNISNLLFGVGPTFMTLLVGLTIFTYIISEFNWKQTFKRMWSYHYGLLVLLLFAMSFMTYGPRIKVNSEVNKVPYQPGTSDFIPGKPLIDHVDRRGQFDNKLQDRPIEMDARERISEEMSSRDYWRTRNTPLSEEE